MAQRQQPITVHHGPSAPYPALPNDPITDEYWWTRLPTHPSWGPHLGETPMTPPTTKYPIHNDRHAITIIRNILADRDDINLNLLSKNSGIPLATITNNLRGKTRMSLPTFIALTHALCCELTITKKQP